MATRRTRKTEAVQGSQAIAAVQQWLVHEAKAKIDVTGVADEPTKTALKDLKDEVRSIKGMLILKGREIKFDGEADDSLKGAVENFQAVHKLPVTGVVDKATREALFA